MDHKTVQTYDKPYSTHLYNYFEKRNLKPEYLEQDYFAQNQRLPSAKSNGQRLFLIGAIKHRKSINRDLNFNNMWSPRLNRRQNQNTKNDLIIYQIKQKMQIGSHTQSTLQKCKSTHLKASMNEWNELQQINYNAEPITSMSNSGRESFMRQKTAKPKSQLIGTRAIKEMLQKKNGLLLNFKQEEGQQLLKNDFIREQIKSSQSKYRMNNVI